MAYSVENNVIRLTRGDTMNVTIELYDGDLPYEPQTGDSCRFAVKRNRMNIPGTEYDDSTPVILKTIPMDTMKLELEPNDTKSLGFGEYVYDIELTKADGTVDTFITASRFILTPEVH